MTLRQWVVFLGLGFLIVELIRGRRAPAVIFLGVAFAFVLLDFVSLQKSLQQLTNSGLVTVVVLLLLTVALDKSRLLELFADRLVQGNYRFALIKVYLGTCLYSAFLNNTAVVASLLGPLRQSRAHAPSRLLMPMCFAASLGGVLTLIGTSTNLLVNSLMIGQGMAPLHIFDLFPVGILIVGACGLAMVAWYPRLLPEQPNVEERASDYFLEAAVRPDSPLVGNTVEAAGLRRLAHLFLTEIVRDGRVIAPVEPDRVIRADDILVFTGDLTRLDLLLQFAGLETRGQQYQLPLDNLVEVVVATESTLARKTLKEANFRAQFDAAVIAVRRGSERLQGPIADVPLQVGDTLVLVVGQDFERRNNLAKNFVVVKQRQVQKFTDHRKGWFVTVTFAAVIATSAFGWVDFLLALLILLCIFLLLRLVTPADLRRQMPYQVIAIIASALVISDVMVSTGTGNLLAGWLLASADRFGPYGALALLLAFTWMLTELMSNNAAAALAFPVALGVSEHLGLQPLPFVMAVLYGASCSFLTPYGYQTNLMVMSPGRYTLRDYLRAGSPVALIFLSVSLMAIPVFFPFVQV